MADTKDGASDLEPDLRRKGKSRIFVGLLAAIFVGIAGYAFWPARRQRAQAYAQCMQVDVGCTCAAGVEGILPRSDFSLSATSIEYLENLARSRERLTETVQRVPITNERANAARNACVQSMSAEVAFYRTTVSTIRTAGQIPSSDFDRGAAGLLSQCRDMRTRVASICRELGNE